MRLVRYQTEDGPRIGIIEADGITPTPYVDMKALIVDGITAYALREARSSNERIPAGRLVAPLDPGKILFCGINYPSHLDENPGAALPKEPFFFSKLPSSVIGPDETIVLPYPECQVDYEVELALVIGSEARQLTPDTALSVVFGYTVVNDVSARDVQFRDNQITLGKGFDTFCPIGPNVTTADEIPDPSRLEVSARVNGEQRQREHTSRMLFDVHTLLTYVTRYITLQPGDVVSTGTPAGVAAFRPDHPYLRDGDLVEVEVDRIGVLRNPVRAAWQ